MAVKKILDRRVVDLDITVKTKDGVVRRLAKLLMGAGYIQDLEGYVRGVHLWESGGITGIGNRMATPHGKSDYVDHVGLAIGHTRDMMERKSYDEQPSDLLFLFVIPTGSEGAKDHSRLIVELAGELGNDSIMTKLQTAKSYDELLEAFT